MAGVGIYSGLLKRDKEKQRKGSREWEERQGRGKLLVLVLKTRE